MRTLHVGHRRRRVFLVAAPAPGAAPGASERSENGGAEIPANQRRPDKDEHDTASASTREARLVKRGFTADASARRGVRGERPGHTKQSPAEHWNANLHMY